MNTPMRSILTASIRAVAMAALCVAALPQAALATGTEPSTDPLLDPAPCVAAAASGDADRIIGVCGALVDSDKTARADRVKALIARAGAFAGQGQIDRAIGDYDTALRLDSTHADVFNARGELWRSKGDRPRAYSIRSTPRPAPTTSRWRRSWSGSVPRWPSRRGRARRRTRRPPPNQLRP
jgi:tetratricopeptide (TPR) repeat protein